MSTVNFTKIWWGKILKDKNKLEMFLSNLHNTEEEAEDRFRLFAETYCKDDKESYDLFRQISGEEKNHALMIKDLIKNLGFELGFKKESKYFKHTLNCVKDKISAAAIGAFAEGLSLKRLRVIIKDENTPTEIKSVFSLIEKDESNHTKYLQSIAGQYGMKDLKDCHDKGLEKLGLLILSKKIQ